MDNTSGKLRRKQNLGDSISSHFEVTYFKTALGAMVGIFDAEGVMKNVLKHMFYAKMNTQKVPA